VIVFIQTADKNELRTYFLHHMWKYEVTWWHSESSV